jgi:outer membrane receptor protein involved in Fe transport
VAQIAPSGLFQGAGPNLTSTFAVNCNNPLLSASQQTALCGTQAGTAALSNLTAGYRFASGNAPRQDDLRHTEYKIDIGSRGELAPGWNYDAYLQYGTSIYSERYLNDVSTSKTQNALLTTDGTTCSGGQAGCVPLNIFSAAGPSAGALSYLLTPGFKEGQTTEQVASASVTGDLGQYGAKSPFANDGVGLALGSEYRRENLVLNTDQEFTSGDLAGQGGPTVGNSGSFDVYELFGEIRVPLVQDKPFAKNLSFDGSYRFSQYSTAGRTDTYEAQFTYNVNRDIGFRGGYSRAVRAPNINELFGAQAVGLFGGNDPCAGATPSASQAQCARSGVTAAQYGNIQQCPAGQCSALFGGNTNLAPEKADTFTLGAVFTPTESFLRGFTLTVDWFDIDVKNVISSQPNLYLQQCVQNGSFCNLIHRDTTGAVFGNTGYVIGTNQNSGFLRTEGVDVEANYRTRFTDWGLPDYGALSFNMDGSYTYEFIDQPVSGGGAYNCAGQYGVTCGTPLPRWRHKARLTWTPPLPFTLSLQWRFIDSVRFDADSANPFLTQGVFNAADAKIPVQNYLDISANYRIRDGLTARFGVNNVLDNNAPIVDANVFPASAPPTGNGNTYPGVYDALGRSFFFGITADF